MAVRMPCDVLHQALTDDDHTGFCLACGAMAFGVEPDARRYACDECGACRVYSAEDMLLMEAYDPA